MADATNQACISFEAMTQTEQRASGLSEVLFKQIREGEIGSGSDFVDFAVLRARSYDPDLVAAFRKIEARIGSNIGHPIMLVETESFQVQEILDQKASESVWTPWRTDTTLKKHTLGRISGSAPLVLDERTWAIPAERYAYFERLHGRPLSDDDVDGGIRREAGYMVVHDYRDGFSSHVGSTSTLVHQQITEATITGSERSRRTAQMQLYIGSSAIARGGRQLAAQQYQLAGALAA